MAKTLPILGATGAALAGLGIAVATGPVLELLVVFVVLAGAVFCFLERSLLGGVLGAVLAVGAIVAALAVMAPITTEDGEYLTGLAGLGPAVTLLMGMGLAGACLALRWGDVEPPWLALASAALLVVGAASLFMVPTAQIGNPTSVAAAAGAICLIGMTPGILAARAT